MPDEAAGGRDDGEAVGLPLKSSEDSSGLRPGRRASDLDGMTEQRFERRRPEEDGGGEDDRVRGRGSFGAGGGGGSEAERERERERAVTGFERPVNRTGTPRDEREKESSDWI